MGKQFEQGEIVYTKDGQEVEYIAALEGDHVVGAMFEREEGEPYRGEPFIVSMVYATAPTPRYEKRIVDLRAEIETLEDQKRTLEREKRALQEGDLDRKKRVMQHAAVARIDDFLLGKITHFVYHQYEYRIMTRDETLTYKQSDYERIPTGVKLLTLFGKTNGDLEWQLWSYSDGSGNPKEVIPCFSEEEAMAVLKGKMEEAYAKWRTDPKSLYYATKAVTAAVKYGFEVPEDVANAVKEQAIKKNTEVRDKAKAAFDAAEAELAAVQNGEGGTGK